MVHFCHVACSVDCFRVRLGLGRESGLGAFKYVMPCGYFEEKYLSWHNPLIQNGRRNNRLGKRNGEISFYAYDGMNVLVGATHQGAVVWRQLSGGGGQLSYGGNCLGAVVQGVMVQGVIVSGGYYLGVICRGSCPGGHLSGGIVLDPGTIPQ